MLLLFAVILVGAWALYSVYGDMPMPGNVAVQETPAPTEPPAPGEEPQGSEAERELPKAPDFTVYDGDGKEVHLSDYIGKPIVLNFWASWCDPCKMEMPDFEAKCKELEGEVVFMMINITDGGRETVDTAKAFLTETGYTFPAYFDTEHSAQYAYGVFSYPTTFFINAEGYLVVYGSGALSAEILQTCIDMIIE